MGDDLPLPVPEAPTASLDDRDGSAEHGSDGSHGAHGVSDDSLVGDLLGQFRVEARIGSGGLGVVYRAYDVKLKRQVALKVLSEGAARVERLLAEARSAAALTHASIAAIYDVQQVGGVAFLVMELVHGRTLRAELAGGRLPVPRALSLATDVAAAIAGAHHVGIVHRDLKPENVVVTPEGRAKILDFGLARHASSLAAGGSVSGTRHYMSPEQAAGQVADARSDVFSFGIVLHEMLTGERPFADRAQPDPRTWTAEAWRRGPRLRVLAPRVPRAVETLVERCLELVPARRPPDGAEIGRALEELTSPRRDPRRMPALAGLALVAALALAAFIGIDHTRRTRGGAVAVPVTSASSASSLAAATAHRTLDVDGTVWDVIEGDWHVEGGEIVAHSGHLQSRRVLTDGVLGLDVLLPERAASPSAIVGIGFRYSLAGGDPRAQCGYGWNFHHAEPESLKSAVFIGANGDWAFMRDGYLATPALRDRWNHVVVRMNGPTFTIEANDASVGTFTDARWTEGGINLWVARGEVHFAHIQLLAADREVVER